MTDGGIGDLMDDFDPLADDPGPRFFARIGDTEVEVEGGSDDDFLTVMAAFDEIREAVFDRGENRENGDERGWE